MKFRPIFVLLAIAVAAVVGLSWFNHQRARPAPPSDPAPRSAANDDPIAESIRPARRSAAGVPGAVASTNNLTPWQLTLLRLQSGETPALPREKVEDYVERCKRDAPSLLAAYRLTRDKSYLTEAAQSHPNDPRIQIAMLGDTSLSPDQRAQWIERLKQSAPENALGNYLAAAELFKTKQPERALQELAAAAAKPRFDDYATADIQATEELLLLAGRSPVEAKGTAFMGTLLPHLQSLTAVSKEMAALVKEQLARGDTAAAENLANMGLAIARQINTGPSRGILIEQLVAMAFEKRVLEPLEQNRSYEFLRQTPAERLAVLQSQRDEIRSLTQKLDAFDPASGLTEPELLVYFERLKNSGELAALRWLNAHRTNAP